ncbi:MAG: AgrD family cyclic lactone autoinducer peptide [Faecalibacillus intestinalis]|uniref:Cyclic lactone autoinducer peptide n=2 Tax=Faecalibacillus TaxID=2678885 RepID=A0AAW4VTF2_9FIRM|nr:cyclic lactone autoinducer peptide [Ruthenibacterium lactatiformans]MBS6429041.1 cyclic lactone autoinducer peptide [Clostridioides difficile]MCA6707063.1 cyclic lactone autoinducer peptide [Enterococcus faecium]MCB5372400.1 cyclic lactone autoinducer peptide [Amedibacillus dolichus]MCB5483626.1 cyclic lactone autoinducer peptide [Blautia faecis]MCB5654176.1 cyclic lactone autoinducer peptide [Mediterraneibacter gnavus]MCB5710852.1 cyclic lactone autoinducer peptide [Blautia wexlerae]MCB5
MRSNTNKACCCLWYQP